MTGRLSLDKAKAIKMQREFAQELGTRLVKSLTAKGFLIQVQYIAEDVVEFEKKIIGRGSRSSAASDAKSEGDQDSEEDEAPVRRHPVSVVVPVFDSIPLLIVHCDSSRQMHERASWLF